jgi:hypothetical protein
MIELGVAGEQQPLRSLSTSKVFKVSEELLNALGADSWVEHEKRPIAARLRPELFYFRRVSDDRMDANLVDAMPCIVAAPWPALAAAQVNTQVEFDRTYRSILKEPDYRGRNLLFVSGLNVDISPEAGQLFPLTKFVPWAAYYQSSDGHRETWEQQELYERIKDQPLENPDQVDLEEAIDIMRKVQEIKLPF